MKENEITSGNWTIRISHHNGLPTKVTIIYQRTTAQGVEVAISELSALQRCLDGLRVTLDCEGVPNNLGLER